MAMTAVQEKVWAELEGFEIDDASAGPAPRDAYTFAMRLAEEQGWCRAYAERVVREYKRFVLLAATGREAVTPSKAVDEAWHLHLLYTRSYWERMCGELFGRPLHHEPTRGGGAEKAKFGGQYTRTLERYAEAFGEAAPVDVWPRPAGASPSLKADDDFASRVSERRRPRSVALAAVGAPVAVLGAWLGMTGDAWVCTAFAAVGAVVVLFGMIGALRQGGGGRRRRGMRDTFFGGCGTSCGSTRGSGAHHAVTGAAMYGALHGTGQDRDGDGVPDHLDSDGGSGADNANDAGGDSGGGSDSGGDSGGGGSSCGSSCGSGCGGGGD